MDVVNSFLIVLATALSTLLTRATPFILFGSKKKEVPKSIIYLSKVLPSSVMIILVVFSLKEVSFATISGWASEAIALTVAVVIHVIKRNTLLSITTSVILYMFLVQRIF